MCPAARAGTRLLPPLLPHSLLGSMARSRSRSRSARRQSAENRGFNYGLFLRTWRSSLLHAPVSWGGRMRIELAKPDAELACSALVRPEGARGLRFVTGATFGVDSSAAMRSWRGAPGTTPCLAVRAPPRDRSWALSSSARLRAQRSGSAPCAYTPSRATPLGGRHGPFASPPRDLAASLS